MTYARNVSRLNKLQRHSDRESIWGCLKGGGDLRPSSIDALLVWDADKGAEILSQVVQGSWWEWSSGSSLVFWRWDGRNQKCAARDGKEIFVSG